MAKSETIGEPIESLAMIAASPKASYTSSVATWSDVRAVEDRRSTVIVHMMTDSSTSHAQSSNQAMERTADRCALHF
jgi:hypothetical protein